MARPQISVYIATSLDGYIARPDNGLDWLETVNAAGEDHGYDAFMASVDCVVLGRETFEVLLLMNAWPFEGKRVVICTHRPIGQRHGEQTHAGPLGPLFDRLGAEGVRRVYLDGGATIRGALADGLVDDLTISTVPVLLGSGRPLFGGTVVPERWRLATSRAFPSGLVQSTWVRGDRDA